MASTLPESLIGLLLEHSRKASGLTIAALCSEAGISTKTYEKLKKKNMTLCTASAGCFAYCKSTSLPKNWGK